MERYSFCILIAIKEGHIHEIQIFCLCAKEAFLALYHAGEFLPGHKLPSELQMAQRLGVSRETWRKALGLLRSDGLIVSRHGSGTSL